MHFTNVLLFMGDFGIAKFEIFFFFGHNLLVLHVIKCYAVNM